MSAKSIFVAGTDTGVGKTLVATALLVAFARRGLRVGGMKPVASGAHETDAGLRNDDALALLAHSNVQLPYSLVNPYCFGPAIAPHIAAQEAQAHIDLATLQEAHEKLAAQADLLIIEGAGGWLTPLNDRETLADFAGRIRAQVVLTVGLRLGCINHALLTANAIEATGVELAGWVANTVDPQMSHQAENLRTLAQRLPAPLLGVIPHSENPTAAFVSGFIDLSCLSPPPE